MILSQLTEAHAINKAVIIKHLDDCGVSDEEVTIGDDGVVNSVSQIPVIFPQAWTRIPIKFGDFSKASFHLAEMKLTSLENMPTIVDTLTIRKQLTMTSLRGIPKVLSMLMVEHTELDSLKGLVPTVDPLSTIILRGLSRVSSLEPLAVMKANTVKLGDCPNLSSLNDLPNEIQVLYLFNLKGLTAVRFSSGFKMTAPGYLYADENLIHKLSPTLIMIDSLREIRLPKNAPVDRFGERILEEYNACLKRPDRKRAFYELQDKLINGLPGFNYNTEHMAEL